MIIDKINTKLGELTIEKSGWSESGYPGFYISLKKNNTTTAEVLFEVDENDELPECKIHIWDSTKEDPIKDLRGCETREDYIELADY
jgi:hypothetical protein